MEIFRDSENAEIPSFATQGSACFDLKACFAAEGKLKAHNPHNKETYIPVKQSNGGLSIQVPPSFRVLIPTGLIFDIPAGYELKMHIRSSMAFKYGIVLANSTGVIDSDYVDPTYIMVYNMSDTPVTIYHGDRVAQAQLVKLEEYNLAETKTRPVKKTDRDGGIGSTGTN
jgi:dUTP pyrophosphatase